jgi:hypothetical protein
VDTPAKHPDERSAGLDGASNAKPRFSLRALFVTMTLAAAAMAFAANFPDIALLLSLIGLFIGLQVVPLAITRRSKRLGSRWVSATALVSVIFFLLLAITTWPSHRERTPQAAALTIVAVFFLFIAASIYTDSRRR